MSECAYVCIVINFTLTLTASKIMGLRHGNEVRDILWNRATNAFHAGVISPENAVRDENSA